jgi:hypothetical protein
MTFLSPLLAWGMILGVIPVIIHLLNRRRFRRVEWAPMRYLKLTIEKNRRRIEIEQLLLLLLRIGLLMLFFFLLARPVLKPTGLERWLGAGGRSSQVVVIDDSLSMGYTAGGRGEKAALTRAKEVATALLAAARPQDRCTLVSTSAPRRPVLHEVEATRRDELTATVSGLPLSATHAVWTAVLSGVDDVVRSCTYPTRQVTIITDLRKAGWDAEARAITRRWAESDGTIRLRVVDVGSDETVNVALERLVPLDRSILAGAASRWEATIRNDTSRLLTGLKAVLRVDDRPTELPLPELPPHESVRVPLNVSFATAATHDLSLELPEDELPGDNRRWAAVPVKDTLLIRLVDGERSSVPFGSEVDYLAAPLSIGIGAAEAWRVEVVPDQDFLSPRLERPDLLVLANVAAVGPDVAERLGALVRDGMGLMIFTGARVDVGLYNGLLYRSVPLLPMPLKTLVEEPIRGVIVEPLRPSPIEALLELKPSALERVAVRQIMTVEEQGQSDAERERVHVLARWNDPARAPALVERIAGDGRVLLWTTTADRAGNDWPVEPSFVLAVREAVRGTARPTKFATTLRAGEPMRRIVHSSQQVANARLTPPGGGEPRALAVVPLREPKGDREPGYAIDVPDTRQAGLYRIAWDEGPLGTQMDLYAANPDPRESALERIGPTELARRLEPLRVEVAAARDNPSGMFAATGREIWYELALVLFALLIVESLFATWVGRSR